MSATSALPRSTTAGARPAPLYRPAPVGRVRLRLPGAPDGRVGAVAEDGAEEVDEHPGGGPPHRLPVDGEDVHREPGTSRLGPPLLTVRRGEVGEGHVEHPVDLGGAGHEQRPAGQHADDRGDRDPGAEGGRRPQAPHGTDETRVEADLLPGLPQRSGDRVLARVDAPAWEAHLPAVGAQGRRAAREDHPRLTVFFEEGDQDRRAAGQVVVGHVLETPARAGEGREDRPDRDPPPRRPRRGPAGLCRLGTGDHTAGYIIPPMPPMPPMPPPPAGAGWGFSGLSATSASVVSSSAAMDAAFWRAERVTLAGSMIPDFTRSVTSPVAALSPVDPVSDSTWRTKTAPSRPAFCAIQRSGSSSAFATMRAPVASSPSSSEATLATAWRLRRSAVPPPATMPSSMAARVAESASSMRCFFSFSSTSVAAPTFTTATPPASLASRSWSFSRSQSESVSSISRLICAMRAFTSDSAPAPSTMVVSSLVTMTLRARPRRSKVAFSSFRPISSELTWPPVGIASPSTSSATTRSGLPACITFSRTGTRSWTALIFPLKNRT